LISAAFDINFLFLKLTAAINGDFKNEKNEEQKTQVFGKIPKNKSTFGALGYSD